MIRKFGFLALLMAFAVACDDNPDVVVNTPGGTGGSITTPSVSIAEIRLNPDGAQTIVIGGTLAVTAAAYDAVAPGGSPIAGISFTWTSSDPAVATVSAAGQITGVASGTATITASATDPVSGATITSTGAEVVTVTVTCDTVPASISLLVATPAIIATQGTSSISATVQDCDPGVGSDVPDGTSVTFVSGNLTLGSITDSPQLTLAENATSTFKANNTAGTVTITASLTSDPTILSTVDVIITPTPVGSIEFDTATPNLVTVKGSGGQESSIINFIVKDVNNNVVADGTPLIFTLIGPMGTSISIPTNPDQESLTFYNVSTVSGNATTTLTSGKVAGTAQVTACVDVHPTTPALTNNGICDPGEISQASTTIAIGGGLPSMTHFSLGVDTRNYAGYNEFVNGIVGNVTAFIADRFGNFNILEGTSVSFSSEGGAIFSSGFSGPNENREALISGLATVEFRTQNPQPVDTDPSDPLNPLTFSGGFETYNNNPNCNGYDLGEPFEDFDLDTFFTFCEHFTDLNYSGYDLQEHNPRDGWVTILVFTKGEESFTDLNGNGVYDVGEPHTDNGGDPFIDENDNGIWDREEVFTDTNADGVWQPWESWTDFDPGEPYYDANNNGSYEVGEPYTDLNQNTVRDAAGFANGVYDDGELYFDKTSDTFVPGPDGFPVPVPDGKWTHGNGLWDGPEAPGTSGGTADTTIWRTTNVVFSGPPNFGPFTSRIVIDPADKNPSVPAEFLIPHQGCASFTIYTGDVNNNSLSTGSAIDITSNGGEVFGGGIIELPNRITGGPFVWIVDLCDPDFSQVSPAAATLEVVVNHDEQNDTVTDYAFPLVRGIIDFVPPLTFVTPSFPDATQNVFYSQTPVASGGVPPYTWAIASGALPNLLSMDSVTGTISGSPDTLAACPTGTFTIRLIDWIGQFVDQAFCINVVP